MEPAARTRRRRSWRALLVVGLLGLFGWAGLPAAGTASEAVAPAAAPAKDLVPRRVAVLPATGEATPQELEEVRTAIHNNLSSKAFELLKPYQVDQALKLLEQSEGLVMATAAPDYLAKRLEVDGLIFVDVPKISRVYGAAYAHQEVTATLRFYSMNRRQVIWDKTESVVEREGGVSLNLLGILATAVTSARVLTEGVRQMLVDRLGRTFAAGIPAPSGAALAVLPPAIEVAFANTAEGPFRAGEEVRVLMRAEPGLAATFDLGSLRTRLRMEEKSPGQYVGRYVVQSGDNAESLMLAVNAVRPRDHAAIEWRVAGRVGLDTVPPPALSALRARPAKDGIRLSWEAPVGSREQLSYLLERADAAGNYQPLAELSILEHLDTAAKAGQTYYYRISARDEAKNRSGYTQQRAHFVAAGPTRVTGDLVEDTTWYAMGSPYEIEGPLRVLRNATLEIEAGTTVRLAPQSSVEVLGRVLGKGTAQAPILWGGQAWRLFLNGTGTTASRFEFSRFSGDSGRIDVDASSLELLGVSLSRLAVGLAVDGGAAVHFSQGRIEQCGTGVLLGSGRLHLEESRLEGNQIALDLVRAIPEHAHKLSFAGNEVHVRSALPWTLSQVAFGDPDFLSAVGRLQGPLRVNWESVADVDNLRAKWLAGAWPQVSAAVLAGRWAAAAEVLATINARADDAGQPLLQAVDIMSGKATEPARLLPRALAQVERQAPGSAALWLQEFTLPYRTGLAAAESHLLSQAAGKFGVAFLDAHYPGRNRQVLVPPPQVARHIKAAQVVHSQRDGAVLRYLVAYAIDRAALEQDLTLSGALVKDLPALMVGVVNAGSQVEAVQNLLSTFDRYRIRYVNLGQGNLGAPLRKRAEQMGANVIVEADLRVQATPTRLSPNLKQFDLQLALTTYDVAQGRPLQRLTSQGATADFSQVEGIAKALGEAYVRVERDLVKALWGAAEGLEVGKGKGERAVASSGR